MMDNLAVKIGNTRGVAKITIYVIVIASVAFYSFFLKGIFVFAASSILTLSNSTASVNTTGLVAYWKFDAVSGSNVSDSSGNGNNGTIVSIVGQTSSSGIVWDGSTRISFSKTTVPAGSTISSVSVHTSTVSPTGNVQVAVYSDSSGAPDSLLTNSTTATLVSGWNALSVTPYYFASSTTIWLAFQFQNSNSVLYQTGGPTNSRYEFNSFGTLPNPAGTTSTYEATSFSQYANYTSVTSGMFGNGLSFLGTSSQYINFGDKTFGMDGTTKAGTWTFWFQRSGNPSGNEVILERGKAGSAIDFQFFVGTGGLLQENNLAGVNTQSSSTVTDGNWHFGAVTYNGSSVVMYVDGVQNGTPASSSNFITYAIGREVDIGRSVYWGSNYFTGKLDEVQIWNRALTANEVRELYLSNASSITVTGSNCPSAVYSNATDVTCNLYRNTSSVTNPDLVPVGYYYYVYNTSGGANWTANSILIPVNVSGTAPTYTNNLTSNPVAYDGSTFSWFNATWNDDVCDSSGNSCFNVSLLEINYTGSLTNYTMSRNGNVSYYSTLLPAGTYQWRIIANDSSSFYNSTPVLTFTINQATYSTSINMTLNATQVWWQDAVNASGFTNASVPVTVYNWTTRLCSITSLASGFWNCTFAAPTGIGIYPILANTSNNVSSSANLDVFPYFGAKGIGNTPRVVYEIPFLIQDLNGTIQKIYVRVEVSK